jgi:type IV secretion system protein VirB4
MARLRGIPHELASDSERAAAARSLNSLWRNIADDTITLNAILVRHKDVKSSADASFHNAFAAGFDRVYRERVLRDQLFANDWFLSLVLSPRVVVGGQTAGREINRRLARFRKQAQTNFYNQSELDELRISIDRGLEGYHLQRLGLRENRGVMFSEIAEALRLILTGESLPVPLLSGPIGNAIYTDRVIFGRKAFEIQRPTGPRYGAIFGLREYMDKTRPGMFDALLQLPMSLVLSQSFGFLHRTEADDKLELKRNQMISAGDPALEQIEELVEARSQLSSKFVMGSHHLSLAVYADDYHELERNAGMARNALAEAGAVVVQESLGMEAAYFAQLPGNLDWRTRPGAISSLNFSHFVNFGAFPHGASEGRWGPALMRFKTTAGTAYDFVPHVDDVGMTVVFGRITSGKTTFLMTLLAMFDQCIGENGIVFFFDKDRGGEISVRAVGGSYLVVRAGEPSGLAPLRGLANIPVDRDFLARWLKGLILLDGHGPMPPEDDARIARAVAAVMRMPAHLRSIEGVRQFLGWRDTHGAGARLERWCCGSGLGWAFDGENDEVDIAGRMVGFDLTSILENPEIVNPAAQYLLYRIRTLMDGRRVVVSLDECRAYMLHERFRKDTEDFLLTARKNNAVIILVTQQPEHLLDGTFGPTMVNQCFTKIFFRNPDADEIVHREKLNMTEGEFRAIREDMLPGSRQCLIKRESGSVIIDFDLGAMAEYVAVFSGRANTIRFAERLRARDGSRLYLNDPGYDPDEGDAGDWVDEFMRRHKEAVD